jgi:crossover junction endodeoxyribonuclease RuvC
MTGWLVAGFDPDAFGAMALVDHQTGELRDVIDMPQVDENQRRYLDVRQLAGIVDPWAEKICEAYVEKGWARPTTPPSYAFRWGHNYGAVRGVISAHFIRLHEVSPQAWKRWAGVSSDKESSRDEASRRFPADCRRWALKKNHGRAEAVLIAAYGRASLLREAA